MGPPLLYTTRTQPFPSLLIAYSTNGQQVLASSHRFSWPGGNTLQSLAKFDFIYPLRDNRN